MKRLINILWSIVGIGILIFAIVVFVVDRDEMIWRMFSIIMPLVGISFWGAIVLSVIQFVRERNKK